MDRKRQLLNKLTETPFFLMGCKVLASLRTLQEETFGNGAEVEIRDVDYNLLSFEDQIRNDLETDVMVS